MAYNITYLNQIVSDLGGSDTYIYEIDALNAICTLLGITAGHTYKIDAMNAIDVNQGGLGGHKYNIDALNSIITLAGETGGYKYEPDAWAVIQQGALLNYLPDQFPGTLRGILVALYDNSTGIDYNKQQEDATVTSTTITLPESTDLIAADTDSGAAIYFVAGTAQTVLFADIYENYGNPLS